MPAAAVIPPPSAIVMASSPSVYSIKGVWIEVEPSISGAVKDVAAVTAPANSKSVKQSNTAAPDPAPSVAITLLFPAAIETFAPDPCVNARA